MPAARHFNIGIMQSTGNAFKKITYDYDLISGKVNNVSYQPGTYDQFHHRYEYDAENRITRVHTSGDGVIWETDARYYYYRHGPLARTETGDLLVQGTDYAYTLQGWLKGVNSSALDPAHDMGEDGSSTSIVARDVYGFSLHYYNTDFTQINTSKTVFAPVNTTVLTGFKPLFNGNIAAMAVNIGQFDRPLIYNYGYDQLNRLVAMDAYTGLNSSTNAWTPVHTSDYRERISYDGNGNILTYRRFGTTLNGNSLPMDSLDYNYAYDGSGRLLNNQLEYVDDHVSSSYTTDIDDQSPGNYTYDAIGNLITDDQEGISEITWNVYGKISSITKSGPVTITYEYDASGNRIGKTVDGKHTCYVRDASGNVMAVYEDENSSVNSGALSQIEVHLYGGARLGMWQANRDVENWPAADVISLTGLSEGGVREKQIRGEKIFELSNHLGNVLVTISDRRVEHNTSGTTIDYYEASVVSASDYYPFGMGMAERNFAGERYRYGFNGMETDNEIKEEGNSYDFGARIYDSRIGRWLSVDPLQEKYPSLSPYVFVANNPIFFIDIDGREIKPHRHEDYSLPAPTWANDLGVTYAGKTSIGFSYNTTTKSWDMDVHAYSSYSRVLQQEGIMFSPTSFEKENPGISAETRAHERGHQDQIFDAAKKEITIKDGKNTYTGTGDVVFTKMTEDKIKALQKRTQDKINNGDFKSQKEVDDYVKKEQQKIINDVGKQVNSKVAENIKNAMDQSTQAKHDAIESDANARGAKKMGRPLRYTQLGEPVKKDGKVLKWKTYEEKKE